MAGLRVRLFSFAWIFSCALMGAGLPGFAQEAGGQFGPAVLPAGQAVIGQTIGRVEVDIARPSGDAARDAAALRDARAALSGLLGQSYRPVLLETALAGLVSRGVVRGAEHRTVVEPARGGLGIVVSLDTAATEASAAKPASRVPGIHKDDRSELTFILGGGAGVYSDSNPWFGQPALFNQFSPVAGRLPGSGTTWSEAYLEFGLGGATRIGESDLYLFGAVSGIYSFSFGQDIFRDDDRDFWHPGRGYVGVLYADPESGNTANCPSVVRHGR
jgi:hypothetical protein